VNTEASVTTETPQHRPLAWSVPDAARQLGLGVSTTWQLVKDRKLRTHKIGARTLISDAELMRFMVSVGAALGTLGGQQ
jgi:excisionase family DNA binding protein